jgi:hypothetical protein
LTQNCLRTGEEYAGEKAAITTLPSISRLRLSLSSSACWIAADQFTTPVEL